MQATVQNNSITAPGVTACTVRVIAERRYLQQEQPVGLISALARIGCDLQVFETDSLALCATNSPFGATDVVLARGRDWPTFSLLRSAELAGAKVINSAAAISSVFDKARMAVELASAGVSTPRTWIGSPRFIAATISATVLPLVVKPVNGDNGAGIHLVRTIDELVELYEPLPVLAQEYIPNDGFDLKIYCIGRKSWLVRKPSGCSALHAIREDEAELLPITDEYLEIADRCRTCFGLELFGVDCIETPAGPVVIEVNEFPNYSAVPNSSERLAEYVQSRMLEGGRQ